MTENLIKYFIDNKDNILYFISISAFAMSVFNTFIFVKNKMPKVKANIICKEIGYNSLIFCIVFENESELPISINKLNICTDEPTVFTCKLNAVWVGERYHPKFPETDIPRTERIFSDNFPINLSSYQSKLSFVVFKMNDEQKLNTVNSSITLELITNRKKYNFKFDLNKINENHILEI